MSQRMKWIAGFTLLIAAVLYWTNRPEVVEVEITGVQPGPLQVTIDEDGETRLRDHALIAAPVTGRLLDSPIRAGDSVVRGQLIARLAPVPLDERSRKQAEAAMAGATALRSAASMRVRQAELALEQAQRDLVRLERLGAAGAIPIRTVENARTEERLRQRELDGARSADDAAGHNEDQARLALLGAASSTTTGVVAIHSPLGGRVLRLFEEHERVITAGTPLMEIGSRSVVEVVVDVLSDDATRIAVGTAMLVRLPEGLPLEARVSRIEPAAFTKVSPLGVEEQRVNVIATLDHASTVIGDKFRVATSLILWSAESVLSVPSTSLTPTDEGWGVYVVEKGRARLRSVSLGHHGQQSVEVTAGLNRGEEIILHPDERIRDGVRVVGSSR